MKGTHKMVNDNKLEKKSKTDRSNENVDKSPGSKPLDPFDPERLRLTQNFADSISVKKALLSVPVRKPSKEDWVRVHPNESYHVETGVIELKDDREVYLVDPALWPELATEATFGPRALFTAINRQGVAFLWPVRLPGPDGRDNQWNRSALEAATAAMKNWVRVVSNMSLGAYEIWESTGPIPDPEWPEQSFRELLQIAFKDKFIQTMDHPVLKKLRGEV
jgi:hypothetical protein